MQVLITGAGFASIYEDALLGGFEKLMVKTDVFRWWRYFKFSPYKTDFDTIGLKFQSLYFKFQNKFIIGPAIFNINRDLIKYAEELKPDLIFIYRGYCIYPTTIKNLRQNGTIVFGYNNDDPFSSSIPKYIHRYYIKSLSEYDWIFAYRLKNLNDYKMLGYNNTSLLRSYYINEINFPISVLPSKKYCHDVVFIGHFEDDGRDEYIKTLMQDDTINFHLYGTLWDRSKYVEQLRSRFDEIKPLYNDYNLALNSAKIALVFLSKQNNDSYTRRCFEITAASAFMLSEYSEELDSMFEEGIEAEYFRNKEEMMDKIKYYLKHNDKREKIAQTGFKRLMQDDHEVSDRAKEIIKTFERM
jgi:spore maturation protein CgeB